MHDVWYIYSAGPALFMHGITKAKICAVWPVVLVRENNMQLASKVFAGYMCHILYVIILLFKSRIGTLNYPHRLPHNHRKVNFNWGYNCISLG